MASDSTMMPATVVLVGCGNMGGALLSGWLDRGMPPSTITVVEPDAANATRAAERQACVVGDPAALALEPVPDIIVIAVKPQRVDAIIADYTRFTAAGSAVLSIAAGKTIGRLQAELGGNAAIVRAMPNTPASIGCGISVACANPLASAQQRAQCDALLTAVGSVLWVDDEALLDAVTAVSGSGPAYVFLLAECLARAGEAVGLPGEVALRLARETVTGAGMLLAHSPLSAESLRGAVTSPGGTTAAALSVLTAENGLQPLLTDAVVAATRRSRELAN